MKSGEDKTIAVHNLRDLRFRSYYDPTIGARQAVMCAYAQSLGDNNTWNYEEKYGELVESGRHFWFCGDFAALKDRKARRSSRLAISP